MSEHSSSKERALQLAAMDPEWLGMSERREALRLLREFVTANEPSEHPPELMAVVDKWQDRANMHRRLLSEGGCALNSTEADMIEGVLTDIRRAAVETETRVEGVVPGSSLERQIQLARKAIAGWPDDVKRAMRINDKL